MKTITTRRALFSLAVLAGFTAALSSCGTADEKKETEEPKYDECYVAGEDGEPVIDCSLPGCKQAPECKSGCTAQAPDCVSGVFTDKKVERICLAGTCMPAGARTEEGVLRRGGLYLPHTFDANVNVNNLNKKGFVITVHHATRPGGGTLTCKDLLKGDADDTSESNVVARTTGKVESINEGEILLTSVRDVPLPEGGSSHLVLSRFYSVSPNNVTKEPGGILYARGCSTVSDIPEGPLPDRQDEAHTLEMEVFTACDIKDKTSCTDGKQCVAGAGFCSYTCEGCTHREVCRPPRPGAEPQCLLSCDPDRGVGCPAGEMPRCDTTPGEIPACLPID